MSATECSFMKVVKRAFLDLRVDWQLEWEAASLRSSPREKNTRERREATAHVTQVRAHMRNDERARHGHQTRNRGATQATQTCFQCVAEVAPSEPDDTTHNEAKGRVAVLPHRKVELDKQKDSAGKFH